MSAWVKRLLSIMLCVAAAGAMSARAQLLSVYGTFSPVHVSHVQSGSAVTSTGSTVQYASFWAPAFGGGLTINFLSVHVATLGLDLRGSTKPGNAGGADTAEAGLLLAFKPPALIFKPYVQAGVGYLATRTASLSTSSTGAPLTGTFTNTYATVGGRVGLDKPILPSLDWRVLEAGYAHAFNTTTLFTPASDANVFSLATGLVVRF